MTDDPKAAPANHEGTAEQGDQVAQKLVVRKLPDDDAWRDMVRIPHHYRRDPTRKHISRGRVCKIAVNGRSALLVVRGYEFKKGEEVQPVILVDSAWRGSLRLKSEHEYEFTITPAGLVAEWLWIWRARDPLIRIPGRIGVISFFLGVLALVLTVPPVVDWVGQHSPHHVASGTTEAIAKKDVLPAAPTESKGFDWVAGWKAASIVLTGAFGVLGLLTDFKDKDTKKVTSWGYVSLAGIVVSTILGTAAQMKETQDTSVKALALAQKTDQTLVDIQRGLSSISGASVRMVLTVPCSDSQYSAFCHSVHAYHEKTGQFLLPKSQWNGWPLFAHINLEVSFLRNVKKNQITHIADKEYIDLIYLLEEVNPTASILAAVNKENGIEIAVDCVPRIFGNNGGIKGILDFDDVTMIISLNELKGFVPTSFRLTTQDGEEIEPDEFPDDQGVYFKKIGIRSPKTFADEDYAALFQADVIRGFHR